VGCTPELSPTLWKRAKFKNERYLSKLFVIQNKSACKNLRKIQADKLNSEEEENG